jgi:hypothetical protein
MHYTPRKEELELKKKREQQETVRKKEEKNLKVGQRLLRRQCSSSK